MKEILFNRPFAAGTETMYINEAIQSGLTAGNHQFSKRCNLYFKQKYGFIQNLLTTSCTDALEMAALLLEIKEGDEVIIPSYTFSSTANAFILKGAHIVFADSYPTNPNINATTIEALITPKTKAIVVVHYAGLACDMDVILAIAKKHDLLVIEDAAQAIDSYYKGKPLGSIGDLAAFSFHQTKNIICGEGGMLVVNNPKFKDRAEIIWEKGTNRASFIRGEIKKYEWIDVGASYLLSDVLAAYLYAQLEQLDRIQEKRRKIWGDYFTRLKDLEQFGVQLPNVPDYASSNGALFYLVLQSLDQRNQLMAHLKAHQISAVFHYQSLHKSPYYKNKHDGRQLPNADRFTERLLRLPLYYSLSEDDQNYIINIIFKFFKP